MPYSNYNKIGDLLRELARSDGSQETALVAESIRNQEIESFAIWRPADEPGAPTTKTYCSLDAIRRLVRFAAELGLVELEDGDRCSLTRRGNAALVEGNYDKTLSTQVALYLKDKVGVTYTEIKEAISSIRRPDVPSFQAVYARIRDQKEIGVPEAEFRGVLYLMERSGMLETQIRKLYFAPEVLL